MPKKVLIVDDEPEIILLIKRRLEKIGLEVITGNTGMRGLELAKKHRPDLMILDVMMPELDGYQVCRLLKFDKDYENIKIILVTARDQQIDKDVGADVRADGYITKPFEPEDLLSRAREMLNLNDQ